MRARAMATLLATLLPMAAWAQPQDAGAGTSKASVVVLDRVVTLRVGQRGRADRTEVVRVELRDDAAVAAFGQLLFPYLPEHERVTLRRLVVVKADGRRVDLSDTKVDDLTNSGGDQAPDARARHVAVPGIVPGDTLEYEITTATVKPLVENHLWTEQSFTRHTVVVHEQFEVRAPADVALLVQARSGLDAQLVQRVEGNERVWRWEHAVPELAVPDLSRPGALEAALRQPPDVIVSTLTTWDAIGEWFAQLVSRRSSVTDAVRAQARALTGGIASDRDRLDALAAFVGEKVRYLSLPLGSRRYEPRPAAEVLTSLYGDCKDKHTLLASLGAAIGLDIRPVLIHSSRDLVDEAPSVIQFDHVVSLAHLADGSEVWVDTTAAVYPAGVLPPPLRGRPALVIDAAPASRGRTATRRVETPEDTGVANESEIRYSGTLAPSGLITGTVAQTFRGDPAFALRLAVRQAGVQLFETVSRQMATDGRSDALAATEGSYNVRGTADRSAPMEVSYAGTKQIKPESMRKAWTFSPPVPPFRFELVRSADGAPARTNAIVLGTPARTRIRAAYEMPEGTSATAPAGVSLSNAFAEYMSRYRVDGRTVHVERDVMTRAFRVPVDQFPQYEAFIKAVHEDSRQTFAMTALPKDLSQPAVTTDDLNSAGADAIDAGDYARAEQLLRRAVEMEPAHKWAWNNLGRALTGLQRYAEAGDAYRRQIEIAPADEYAFGNLARLHLLTGKVAEAETAIRQHLQVKPRDEWGWSTLGRILAQQGKHREAVDAFEQASAHAPASAPPLFLAAREHMFLGESDKALASIDRAVAIAPTALGYGNAANELAFIGAPASRIQRYATRALDLAEKALEAVTLEDAPEKWLAPTKAVAVAAEALGTLATSRGEPAQAEPWLLAAWRLFERTGSGGMLATVYEVSGRKEEARLLAAQLAEIDGEGSQAATLFTSLVTDAGQRADLTARAKAATQSARRRPFTLKGGGQARIVVSVAPDGKIDEVRFAGGDESMRATVQALIGQSLDLGAPAARPLRLIRHAEIACGATPPCELVLGPILPPGVDEWELR